MEPPVDAGGFENFFEAFFHKLGIDYIRAEAGELPGVTVDDIEAERHRAEALEAHGAPSPAELAEFGLFGAVDRRKLHPRKRRQWHTERALRLVSAL